MLPLAMLMLINVINVAIDVLGSSPDVGSVLAHFLLHLQQAVSRRTEVRKYIYCKIKILDILWPKN